MKLSEKVRSISAKVGMGAAVLGASTVAAFATSSGPATTAATTAASTFTSDGTGAVVAIGGALLGLAGIAVVFKWAKAMFFG
jgi:Ca2+/Na+ antiporter